MITQTASVKVMRSYDYCHFEIMLGISNDSGLSPADIDNARKDAQRLADKSVEQYKKAKQMAARRSNGEYEMASFEEECKKIEAKDEINRTMKEIAMLKQYKDENWRKQFDYDYDYED